MWSKRSCNEGNRVKSFLGFFILLNLSSVSAQSKWKTLSGLAPVVVAKGGFSGLFPDSSLYAFANAMQFSAPSTIIQCDVRLTKDFVGVCLPSLQMNNCTDIERVYSGASTYVVNGVSVSGYFPIDFTLKELVNVSLIQSIFSRTERFDSLFPIIPVEGLPTIFKSPPPIWLNIEHDAFYTEHNLNMTMYIEGLVNRTVKFNYISSPEISFLASISTIVSNNTKLIFKFLDSDLLEPSTKQTYSDLLSNLTYIRTFANGILVPKTYIGPVSTDNYLLPYTSVVVDAHKAGLEVYAGNFANDNHFSHNYSLDPLQEYLSYIDNGVFSVDGFVTDFPNTPSEAIGCFTSLNMKNKSHDKPLIISHNGGSGDYADCTDLAYQHAVDSGADIIDCPVQVTKDGILVCMSNINIINTTTIVGSAYSPRITDVPEFGKGFFTFNLTWNEINNLKPKIKVGRNPRFSNAGKFMTLSDFLTFAKNKDLAGVLISVENAAFITRKLGLDIVGSILKILNTSGYGSPTSPPVTIQSTNSSVLISFKEKSPNKLKLMYTLNEEVSDADPVSVADMKRFADAIAVEKRSIFPLNRFFTTYETKLVKNLQAQGFPVYVYVLMNEFMSIAWDYFSDATVEINSFVQTAGVDGIITDFPFTARRYKVNTCQNMGNNTPRYMLPVQIGGLLKLLSPQAQPPALAPLPVLTGGDVSESPLSPTTNQTTPPSSLASPRISSGASISTLIVVLYILFVLI